MSVETILDLTTILLLAPFALLMAVVGNYISAVGILTFSTIALLRLTSASVQNWTNEHQWRFLVILVAITVPVMLDAMSTG